MRFLLTTMPIPGHVQPMLPIARQLVERGHDVAWYTGMMFRDAVTATGAEYLAMRAAPDHDLTDDRVLPGRHELKGLAQLKFYIKHLFLDPVAAQMEDLESYLADRPVDAFLSDVTFLGALFLAEKGGPPCALLGATPVPLSSRDTAPYGLAMPPGVSAVARIRNTLLNWLLNRVVFRDVNRYANGIRRSVGLPAAGYPFLDTAKTVSALYLQPTGESFEYPRRDWPRQFRFIGPLVQLPVGPFTPPAWWGELSAGRRVVLVTQGTIATHPSLLTVPTLQALADQDLLVVATTGRPVGEFPLQPWPVNARVERFIPYRELLPRVDVLVTNGGYGGVQIALAHGVPLVVAGHSEDKAEVAARVAWAGVGIALKTVSPTPAEIAAAVRAVLDDPRYRRNAQRTQADFARHDAPLEAAQLMEQLAERYALAQTRARPEPALRPQAVMTT